eukprot:CAMPEP_0182451726 /NCGR_PEP_ID=MMETSP1172-20130603/43874_1 /TAXON_ID=708627 /ORGANISM="Timspurckia oligopyrenoides, Strain CCMP3278" /LENGTH=535 /DNA_ID=CAMNT_0024649517 /DNA_START=368 /DNA_END=1975 /DNA_ORIENTATION=+
MFCDSQSMPSVRGPNAAFAYLPMIKASAKAFPCIVCTSARIAHRPLQSNVARGSKSRAVMCSISLADSGLLESINLQLSVTDPELVQILNRLDSTDARDDFALKALKIGAVTLLSANTRLDVDLLQNQTNVFLDRMESHIDSLTTKMSTSYSEYFNPETGSLTKTMGNLVKEDGDLARVLDGHVEDVKSELSTALQSFLGQDSELMKKLSTSDKQGVLNLFETNLKNCLNEQFSLDIQTSALSRMVQKMKESNTESRNDNAEMVNALKKELSLDEKDSALSRVVKSLNEGLDGVRKLVEENKIRKEEVDKSPQKGIDFEAAVGEFLAENLYSPGDILTPTGTTFGSIPKCKVGDFVMELSADSKAEGARIVFEAKANKSFTVENALKELKVAKENRNAQMGVLVFSAENDTPQEIEVFRRFGNDLLVCWSPGSWKHSIYLRSVIAVVYALAIRTVCADSENISLELQLAKLLETVEILEDQHKLLTTVQDCSRAISKQAEKIDGQAGEMKTKLSDNIVALKTHTEGLKQIQTADV